MYNNLTFEEVENNMPTNMHPVERDLYLKNVKQFIKLGDTNKGFKECILNFNTYLIKPYIETNK